MQSGIEAERKFLPIRHVHTDNKIQDAELLNPEGCEVLMAVYTKTVPPSRLAEDASIIRVISPDSYLDSHVFEPRSRLPTVLRVSWFCTVPEGKL
jgi:hypothetical protein